MVTAPPAVNPRRPVTVGHRPLRARDGTGRRSFPRGPADGGMERY